MHSFLYSPVAGKVMADIRDTISLLRPLALEFTMVKSFIRQLFEKGIKNSNASRIVGGS